MSARLWPFARRRSRRLLASPRQQPARHPATSGWSARPDRFPKPPAARRWALSKPKSSRFRRRPREAVCRRDSRRRNPHGHWATGRRSGMPLCASQSRMRPSPRPPEAIVLPSGDHDRLMMWLLWPTSTRISLPVASSQIWIEPSTPPVAANWQSGLRASALSRPRCCRVSTVQLTAPVSLAGSVTSAMRLMASPGESLSGWASILTGSIFAAVPDSPAATNDSPPSNAMKMTRAKPGNRTIISVSSYKTE